MIKKNKLLIIGAIILVLIIGAIIIFAGGKKIGIVPSPTPNILTTETRKEIPKDAKVYEVGESVPEGVAAPLSVSTMNEETGVSLRAFSITAEKDKFTPNTLTVYENDIMKLFVNAVDKDYVIVQKDMGVTIKFEKGNKNKYLEAQIFEGPGDYIFYCENCGGLNSTAVGHIIVLPRSAKKE